MNDTAAAAPVDDIWATKHPELVAGRGYAWSSQAKPLSSRLNLLRAAVFAMMAVQLYSLMVTIGAYALIQQVVQGVTADNPIFSVFAQVAGLTGNFLMPVTIIIVIACAISYVMFVHRGIKNLELSGARNLTLSAGWGAGSIFVPFVNWVVPYSAMRQLWIGSHDPVAGKYDPPMVINIWWATWIGGNILGTILNYMIPSEASAAYMTPEQYLAAMTPWLITATGGFALTIASCFCLLAIIKQITAAQDSLRSTAAFDE